MKQLTMALLIAASLGSFAMAHEPGKDGPGGQEGQHGRPDMEACKDLQLTTDQTNLMKAEHLKFDEKRIDLEANLKKAHLNYLKVVSNEKSDEKAIRTAAEYVASEQSKMGTAEELFHAEILIKVFKPAQRAEALNCQMKMHHHDGGPHDGGDHEKGPKGHE